MLYEYNLDVSCDRGNYSKHDATHVQKYYPWDFPTEKQTDRQNKFLDEFNVALNAIQKKEQFCNCPKYK